MEDRIFAVIDTNVLVSALISTRSDTPPFIIMAQVYSGVITSVYNAEILKEYRDVLSREKFHLSEECIDKALSVIRDYGLCLERTAVEDETFPDPKDVVFYEVALSKEDAYLVTGNTKHFPKSPIVVTPAEMLAIIEGNSEIKKNQVPASGNK